VDPLPPAAPLRHFVFRALIRTSLDVLDADHASDRAGGGQRRGEQPVGGLAAQDRDPDQQAERDEAEAVAESEDERLVLKPRQQPEEEEPGEQGELDVGGDLDPAKERARDDGPQRSAL
jgi:hypothetical protein